MKRFNSLEAYEKLIEAGVSPIEAKAQVLNSDHFWNDIISDFLTNKMAAFIIAIVAAVGLYLVAESWRMSTNIERMSVQMDILKDIIINKMPSSSEVE